MFFRSDVKLHASWDFWPNWSPQCRLYISILLQSVVDCGIRSVSLMELFEEQLSYFAVAFGQVDVILYLFEVDGGGGRLLIQLHFWFAYYTNAWNMPDDIYLLNKCISEHGWSQRSQVSCSFGLASKKKILKKKIVATEDKVKHNMAKSGRTERTYQTACRT